MCREKQMNISVIKKYYAETTLIEKFIISSFVFFQKNFMTNLTILDIRWTRVVSRVDSNNDVNHKYNLFNFA